MGRIKVLQNIWGQSKLKIHGKHYRRNKNSTKIRKQCKLKIQEPHIGRIKI